MAQHNSSARPSSALAALGLAALALAACGEGANKPAQDKPAAVRAEVEPQGPLWTAPENAPDVIIDRNAVVIPEAGARIALVKGQTARFVFENSAVPAGGTRTATVRMWAPEETAAHLILIRACDDPNGEEFEKVEAVLRPEPITVTAKKTFTAAYGCLRVDVSSEQPEAVIYVGVPTLAEG